jgi:hypothetical protein
MDIGGVSSGAGVGGLAGSRDPADLSFAVAVLQLQALDDEICARLVEMEQLNAVRKTMNDHVNVLRGYLQRLEDGKGWVPAEALAVAGYTWDASANDGAGGPVAQTEGLGAALGDAQYRVRDADGSPLKLGEILDRPEGERAWAAWAAGRIFGFPAGELPVDAIMRETWAGRIDFQTASFEEARAMAEQRGGSVEVQVTREQLQGRIDALLDGVENLGSDREIGMLGLNRLLSSRNQVLQLASNVMSSVHQTAMGIIANLKV